MDNNNINMQEQNQLQACISTFKLLFNHAEDCVMIFDANAEPVYVNATGCGRLGIQALNQLAETLGKVISKPARAKKKFTTSLTALVDGIKAGRHQQVQVLIESPKIKANLYETLYFSPLYDQNKTLLGAIAIGRDLDDQHRLLQAEINNQQTEYNTLVNNLPMTLIRYDLACRRHYVSPYVLGAYTLADNLILGKSPAEQWSADIVNISGAEYAELIAEAMRDKKQVDTEIIIQHSNTHYVNQVKIVPELDPKGKVVGALAIINDISELAEYRSTIEHLAYHDALTGIDNRLLFGQKTAKTMLDAAANHTNFALMVLDLDQFKTINDSMGHAVGDGLLVQVAQRIAAVLSKTDEFARLGGDEFGILVRQFKHRSDLEQLSKHLLAAIAQPFYIEHAEYFVTASLGVATYPQDGEAIGDLMKYADSAMYSAKAWGGNGFRFYSQSMTTDIQRDLRTKNALQYGLKNNEMYIEYQPIYDTQTAALVGAEALCRWHSKELGIVSPTEFIRIAEQAGLIVQLGSWVLAQAMQVAALLNQSRAQPIAISINLSARQFLELSFVQQVEQLLKTTACKPNWVKFEITETLLMRDEENVRSAMKALNAMGIQIAIDDFGTGYSALAYLNKFPIQQVKIDRSFVSGIGEDEASLALVKAIVAMASSLGKDLVAEGVETQQQLHLLKSIGCAYVQGYYHAKPMSISALQALIAQK